MRFRSFATFPVLLAGAIIVVLAAALNVQVIGAPALYGLVVACLLGVGTAHYFLHMDGLLRAHLTPATVSTLIRTIESAPNGRAITDGDGDVLYGNAAYRALVGEDDPLPTPLDLPLAGGEDLDKIERLFQLASEARGGSEEVCLVGADGNKSWYLISTQPLYLEGGSVAWLFSDVTDQHHAMFEEQNEDRLKAENLDRAPIGFYSADMEGRFLYVNDTLAEWLGYSRAELVAGDVSLGDIGGEVHGPDALPSWESARKWHKFRTKNGDPLPVEVIETIDRGRRGGALFSRSIVRDLRAEWRSGEDFSGASSQIARVFDYAPIGIALMTPEGKVVEANAAFRALTGSQGKDGGLDNFYEIVSKEDRTRLMAMTGDAAVGKLPADNSLEIKFEAAPDRVAQLYVSRIEDGDPGAKGVILHLIDTTEQRNLEDRFAQSQKMQAVGQLAGGIAHDFNNLLTAILGFCDLLMVRHQPGDPSFADIMQIKQNTNRAANLVRQLLAFSRRQTLQSKILSITDVLAELSNLLGRLIGESIELKMVHGRNIGMLKGDQGQLEQVIINLAVNARDAMPGGGTLTISTSNVSRDQSRLIRGETLPEGEYVLIEVKDTGTGIEEEIMDKIFEPFFTTKEVGAGTGLGLSTVYGIVDQTGGVILPYSRVGKGTTFRIYLPAYEPTREELEALEAESIGLVTVQDLTGKETILLVEDEDPVRIFASRALVNKGYTVLEADNGEAALEILNEYDGRIELLISDVIMPRMDGPTLMRQARQQRPDIKCILISGYAEAEARGDLSAEDDFTFLPKPFSLKQLAGCVKNVLSGRESA